MFIGNAILLFLNLPMAGLWAKLTQVPTKLLFPIILAIAVLGAYSIKNSVFDIGVMLGFGLLGYLLKKLDIPLAPVVLTFILGGLIESSLSQALVMYQGNFFRFFTNPLTAPLLILAALILVVSVIAGIMKKKDMLASDTDI
jgi:putative tricarboxylic transport membrane protein